MVAFASMTIRPPPERLRRLDGLRGIAALAVVISHCANIGLLPAFLGAGFGKMGVGLFYSLSAFLLGHLYFNTRCCTDARRRYALSRTARVLPLFYTALAATALIYPLTGRAFYGIKSLQDFALNAALIQGTSVLWSIPVELQYYLVFVLLWWLHMVRGWTIWQVIALGLALQMTAALAMVMRLPQAELYSTGALTLAGWGHMFLCGLVLSQVERRTLTRRAAPLQAFLLSAIVVLAIPELRRSLGLPVYPSFIDPLTTGVPLLLLYLTLRNAAPLRFLESPVLCWLGGISYGLYLIHVPVISTLNQLGVFAAVPEAGLVLVLGLSLAMAWLAHQVIELPAQRRVRSHMTGLAPRAA